MADAIIERSIVRKIIENASRIPSPYTYIGTDGLKHCSRCHGMREHTVKVDGVFNGIKVPCICACMQERYDASLESQRKKQLELKIMEYRSLGFAERRYESMTFDADANAGSKLSNAMKRYCDNFDKFRERGLGLLLYGPCGTGKTFYAACIVNQLINSGRPAMLTNFARLVNQVQATKFENRQDFYDSLARVDLIAIDDLGVERGTEYMTEQMELIIDQLYRAGTPMVITSNYSPEWMMREQELRRKRMYDRLLERCHAVEIAGESKRIQAGRQNHWPVHKELGLSGGEDASGTRA